ncbi:MAG: SUF system Fe-S cluster assembly regulator [Oligoflexia bacterium]|nr:SUF system Fe-S cluster assembly regulator [Oligoflexia bacterium]
MSKLTDYGIVLLTHFAKNPNGTSLTARELSEKSGVPLPTVGKLLKTLCRGEILESQRGINGGYTLTHPPVTITVASIINLLEGPVALTDCTSTTKHGDCEIENHCPVKGSWKKINSVVLKALEGLTLADMTSSHQKTTSQSAPQEINQ